MDKKLIDEARELYDERVNFQVRFKRPVFTEFPSSGVQLHIFADASGYAYGCVAYLRYLTRDGKYRTSLIFSKSRLAPLKPIMSITKLELTAAALAGHVAQFLKDELQSVVKIDRTFIHTDSTTVLYWLKNPLNKGRYVINRVKKLIATDAEFRHIAGVENPADVVSRGCSPAEFLAHKSWFVGPAFLCQSEEFWPRQPNSEELKVEPQVIAHVNACTQIYIEALPPMVNAKRMRTWTSLVNATSKALEFVFKISKGFPLVQKRIFGTSVLDEFLLIKMSEKLLLIQIQHSNEVLAEKIHALDLYCDKGIWRKYNRIENEADPIYLVDCAASQLLILQLHEATNHGSVSMVLGQLNKSYFLPKARSLLKSIIRKRCMRCRRLKALPFALPLMKDLPNVRTHGKPFESIGVDLCGPFKVKLHQEVLSAWIVVYTCLVSRAVHLELVTSLSGEAFIDSLTRFASRRGMPSFIYSDNGTNLKVASLTVIPQWITQDDPNVMNFCTSKKIRWKFVTEKTPWAGGVYEAMVKLVKRNLKIAIGKKQLLLIVGLLLMYQMILIK
uniref:Integrase catalytic domain-containing protein n=1 Tax=Panagrolaimus superbus TaxID=310955 RepID=A0A914Y5B7_9BILA